VYDGALVKVIFDFTASNEYNLVARRLRHKNSERAKIMNFKFMLLVSIILGTSLFSSHGFCADEAVSQEKENIGLINPLLRYMKFKELRSFRGQLAELIEKKKGQGLVQEASVYFRSLTVGIWIGVNEREAFCPASILKIPVMMTYFKMAEKDPAILEKKIKYVPKNPTGFVPGLAQKSSAEIGKDYSVDKLIELMITESDNVADLLLLYNLPPNHLERTFSDFGMNLSELSPSEDFVSLKIIATFLRVLYNASYLNENMSEKALRYLTESTYRDGIVAGLPKDIVVAHKFGERFFMNTKELHEVAIVYYPENPYILAIMTKGDNHNKLAKLMKDISELVYQEVDSQYRTEKTDSSLNIE
jgi:beta-lactamase class A